MAAASVLDLIGQTPLVRLHAASKATMAVARASGAPVNTECH